MTQETYEQARIIERQIAHIDDVLKFITPYEYKCEPPTRCTSFALRRTAGSQGCVPTYVDLSEGEIVTFRDALELKKEQLKKQFEEL